MSTRVLATTLRGLTAAPVGGEAAGGTVNTAANTKRAPLRIGVLGAANINGAAIIAPCFTSPEEAKITALAARDRARADEHADEHKLEGCVIFDGYDDLIANADVDAIYVPSPNTRMILNTLLPPLWS